VAKSRLAHDAPTNNTSEAESFAFGANVPAGDAAEPPPVPPGAPDEPVIDPYDPATYRVSLDLSAAGGVKEVLAQLDVRTPDKAWWVRRHPDYSMAAWVIELKDEGETYLVLPHLYPLLTKKEATFKRKAFHLAQTMQGKLFLWAVNIPADDGGEITKWMKAPHEAARLALTGWVRLAWNEQTRQHDVRVSDETAEPSWPDRPFRDLIELGFEGKVIDRPDHPVLRQLRGKKA
jgi:hypothetical protein